MSDPVEVLARIMAEYAHAEKRGRAVYWPDVANQAIAQITPALVAEAVAAERAKVVRLEGELAACRAHNRTLNRERKRANAAAKAARSKT